MHEMSPTRVMLVDDQPLIRRGVINFLRAYADIRMLVEAADGEEAVRLCTQYHPDIILMEIALPRMNGITATQIIRSRYPQIQVVMFTNIVDNTSVKDALTAGAVGYLLKSASPDELAKAIRSAAQGQNYMAHEATQCLLHVAIDQKPPLGHDLTNREREVLNLMATGMNNRAIAESLTVSQSTVKFHMSNILSKLHTKARTEAIGVALRHNLVTA
ncbi:MAG: response regulator transcription factor [Caldilineaceae bacterium]